MSDASVTMTHITSEQLAAYLDQRLDHAAATDLESHLADCAECRADLVDARALLQSSGVAPARARPGPRRAGVWLAAAAILVIAILPLAQHVVQPARDFAATRSAEPSRQTIPVLAPGKQSVDVTAIVFVWRPVADASTYRLTLTDSSGSPLFTTATAETTATLPARIALHRGSTYLWYVDCLTVGGRSVSSGIRSFSTSR